MDKVVKGCKIWKSLSPYYVLAGLCIIGTLISSTYYNMLIFTTKPIKDKGGFMLNTTALTRTVQNTNMPYCTCNCGFAQNSSESQFSSTSNIELEANQTAVFVPSTTLEEAFFNKMIHMDVSQGTHNLTWEENVNFKTKFSSNENYMNFPLLSIENVCMDVSGALLLINTNEEEIYANISGHSSIPELYYMWTEIYTCNGNITTDNCVGATFTSSFPKNYTYFRGTTAHMAPYVGNSMHNWAERTWPYVIAASSPLNSSSLYPINYYIIHRFDKWLEESKHVADRAQLLWQFRMAMEISGSLNPVYLLTNKQLHPVCFERLILQQHTRERIDQTRLPLKIAGPGVRKYREAIFNFFGMHQPKVRLPPSKLRVLLYGRNDTSRRRIMNAHEVITMLQNFSMPPLEVHVLDEMLATRETDYSFPEVIRIFSQTDILLIAHGANTWATFLLPEGGGVVEIFGPCNWSGANNTDLRVMHSWMHVNAAAIKLKHDISNPFREAIPNPQHGNTTMCQDPFSGVPDYTVDVDKLKNIIDEFAYPSVPGDRLTQHWLYDWDA